MGITCAPTQHFKSLNPHLDHAAFEAIFITETNPYKYKQGHCQVSSFGVGGTNGHAIFWGEGYKPPPDFRKVFTNKMLGAMAPIIADGSDPSGWEFSGLPFDAAADDKYSIIFTKDPVTGTDEVRYEKQVEEYIAPEFYCITGSHNEWSDDRMMEGDVPGCFFTELEVPESGSFEFRILAEGDPDKAFGPEFSSSKRTTPILGPQANINTAWEVRSVPERTLRVEFFAPAPVRGQQVRSISWFLVRDEE